MRMRTMVRTTDPTLIAAIMLTVIGGCASGGKRLNVSAARNPTTLAGRGAPSLDEERRPCAWVLIDGHHGHYIEEDGTPQIQWIIDEPVSSTPTVRVEVFKPLLGAPTDFRCVVVPSESTEGALAGYAIAAKDGTFRARRDYSMVDLGPDFDLRNADTGHVLDKIDPLAPGPYLISAKIENREKNVTTLAVTYFTVAADTPTAQSE